MAADVHEGGDEGYFASVSDLMVGVLFVFLLLLTVFALNLRDQQDRSQEDYEKLLAALTNEKKAAEYARADAEREKAHAAQAQRLADAQKMLALAAQDEARRQQTEAELRKAEAEKERQAAEVQRLRNAELLAALRQALAQLENEGRGREQARTQLLDDLASSLQARGVRVTTIPDAGILRLPEDVLFRTGDQTLNPEAEPRLHVLADVMSQTLPCFSGREKLAGCETSLGPVLEAVLVEGHSDKQPFRRRPEESEQRNDRLSAERALTVFATLRRNSRALDAMTNTNGRSLLAVSAYGDRRPAVSGETEDAYKQNRRIDLRFLLSSRPSDELQQLIESIRRTLQDAS